MRASSPPPTRKPVRPDSAEDWDRHREAIQQLYWIEDRELIEVMETMRQRYNFQGTVKQYKDTFKRWGLEKNVKAYEMEAMVQIRARRREVEGRETEFLLRGRRVPQEKIDRYIRRQRHKGIQQATASSYRDNGGSDTQVPPGLVFYTPPAAVNSYLQEVGNLADTSSTSGVLALRSAERPPSPHAEFRAPVFYEFSEDHKRRNLIDHFRSFLAPALIISEDSGCPLREQILPLAMGSEPLLNSIYSLASASLEHRGANTPGSSLVFHGSSLLVLKSLIESGHIDRNMTLAAMLLLLYHQTLFTDNRIQTAVHLQYALEVMRSFRHTTYSDPTSRFLEDAFRFYDIIASLSLGTSLSFGDPTQPGTSFVEPDANRLRPLETIFGLSSTLVPILHMLAKIVPLKRDILEATANNESPSKLAALQGELATTTETVRSDLHSWHLQLPPTVTPFDPNLPAVALLTESDRRANLTLQKSLAYHHSAFIYLHGAVDGHPPAHPAVQPHAHQTLLHCAAGVALGCPMVALLWPLTIAAHYARSAEDRALASGVLGDLERREGGIVVTRMRARIERTWTAGLVGEKYGEEEEVVQDAPGDP